MKFLFMVKFVSKVNDIEIVMNNIQADSSDHASIVAEGMIKNPENWTILYTETKGGPCT